MIEIGFREVKGKEFPVSVNLRDLLHHQYILGATGTGKSTLIANEIVQAFEGKACCIVIDPHGDLSVNIVRAVKPENLDKVYLLDPLRVKFSLNPLELPSGEREIVSEKMVAEITEFFKKLYGVQYWGPSLNRLFQDGLRALYQSDDAPTLKDLYDLVDGKIRHKEFQEELKKLPRGRTDSVLNKLAPFVRNRFLKRILCRKFSSVRLGEIIEPERLIVFRLPKGELSEMISVLIGSAVITKLWYISMSGKSFPVILAVDEFHLFSHLETLRNIIAEGRKYKLGLMLAHQHTLQLSPELFGDVFSNSGIKVIFRVSGEDAILVSKNLGIEVDEITKLPDGRAFVYLSGRISGETKIFELSTLPLFARNSRVEEVVEKTKVFEVEEREVEDAEVFELVNVIDSLKKEEIKVSDVFKAYREKRAISGSELSALIEKAENLGFIKRSVIRQGRGRPKITVELTERAEEILGYKRAKSKSAGGEKHAELALKFAENLRKNGFSVVFPLQKPGKELPDAFAYRKVGDEWIEIAIEVEVRADHPEQVMKNYEKNVKAGREVIFVVPDEKVKERVERILGDREKYSVVVVKE